jgi:hypothetical protein
MHADRTKDTSFFDQCHVRCWFRDSVVLELHGSTFRGSSAFDNQSLHKPAEICTLSTSHWYALERWHLVLHGRAHRIQLVVLLFGNLNSIGLPQFHNNVQKIHAVKFHLLSESDSVIQTRLIFIRNNSLQNLQNYLSDLLTRHQSSPSYAICTAFDAFHNSAEHL